MRIFKKVLSLTIIVALLAGICVMSTISSAASGTGTGLAEWALNAYNSGWSYVYGGASPGAVDCSGLIYSYAGGIRTGDAQLYASDYTGSVSGGVPRIHGLGLWKPGHVGVYVGNEMAVDARGSQWGVCYESVYTHGWTTYFKVAGVTYPTTGFVDFNGSKYYYEDGQYVVNTTKTIDGVSYTFDASGKCTSNGKPSSSSSSDSSSSKETTSNSTLKRGSTGERVVKLQSRLAELGYYNGVIDGHFGEGTEEAFKLFQETAGLYVDGLAGHDVEYLYADDAPRYEPDSKPEFEIENNKDDDETAQTSMADEESDTQTEDTENTEVTDDSEAEDVTPTSYSKGDYHEEIVNIQNRLSELSYYNGTADGSFGSMTEDAVKSFQSNNGITQTGVVDEFTHDVLFSESAVKNTVTDPTEELKVVDSELPVSAQIANKKAKTAPTEAPATEVVLETNKLSEKALAGIANSIGFESDANGNNFQFIFWLLVMIVVMTITFAVVNTIEKKKAGKKSSHKYF